MLVSFYLWNHFHFSSVFYWHYELKFNSIQIVIFALYGDQYILECKHYVVKIKCSHTYTNEPEKNSSLNLVTKMFIFHSFSRKQKEIKLLVTFSSKVECFADGQAQKQQARPHTEAKVNL